MYSIELKVDSSTYQEVMQFLATVNTFSLKTQQLDTNLNYTNRDELITSFNQEAISITPAQQEELNYRLEAYKADKNPGRPAEIVISQIRQSL